MATAFDNLMDENALTRAATSSLRASTEARAFYMRVY